MKDIFSMREDSIRSYINFIFASSCMPTLMKMKPSTMVSFHKRYMENATSFYYALESELNRYQCSYEKLHECDAVICLLIYDESHMEQVFTSYVNHELLEGVGYHIGRKHTEYNIKLFAKRFSEYKEYKTEFPHEVGLLLGYPIEDVESFIENDGNNFILCGFWKVYHNKERAIRIFDAYKQLREIAMGNFYRGLDLTNNMIVVS